MKELFPRAVLLGLDEMLSDCSCWPAREGLDQCQHHVERVTLYLAREEFGRRGIEGHSCGKQFLALAPFQHVSDEVRLLGLIADRLQYVELKAALRRRPGRPQEIGQILL